MRYLSIYVVLITACLSSAIDTKDYPIPVAQMIQQIVAYTNDLEANSQAPEVQTVTVPQRHSAGNGTLQELFEKFMKKVKEIIEKNYSLDIPHTELNFDNKIIKLKGYLDEVVISDFSNYSVDPLIATESLHVELGLHFNKIVMTSTADIDFNVLTLFPIFGDGALGVMVSGLELSVVGDFAETGFNNTLVATDLKLNYSIAKIEISLANLMGGGPISDFLNGVVTDCAAKILMAYRHLTLPLADRLLKWGLQRVTASYGITLKVVEDFMEYVINIE